MDTSTSHLFGALGESERDALLEALAGDGPELGILLTDLAEVAGSQGRTKLANMLYNSALFQEEARGRVSSSVAIESLGALANTDLKLGNVPQALGWAHRLERVAPDDTTRRRAARILSRVMKSLAGMEGVTPEPGVAPKRPPQVGGIPLSEFEPMQSTTTLDDVGGLGSAKDALRRVAILPHRDPESAARFGIKMGGGVLLYGPPGCGKTLLAEATAGEMGVPIIKVKAADLLHPLYGMGERNLAQAFTVARDNAPCVLFFDEIDGIAQSRSTDFLHRSLVTPLLAEIEALASAPGVLLIGATNLIDRLDVAVTRPGRFDKVVAVDMPDIAAREAVWSKVLRAYPCSDDVECVLLAGLSDGLSGADIAEVARTAAESVWMHYLRTDEERKIETFDLLIALRGRFTAGKTKLVIDDLLESGWREMLG